MDKNEIQGAIGAGLLLADTRSVPSDLKDHHAFVVIPEASKLQDLEGFLQCPLRKVGKVNMADSASFIRFVNESQTPSTRIYASKAPPVFVAVFNDHGDDPGWRDHQARYACPMSIEWEKWASADGKKMSQVEFAQFIENNLPDVASPPAAQMLEVSRSLEAKKKVNFSSDIRLSDGQTQFGYEEEISGTTSKGSLLVPTEFQLGIPVLLGGAPYQVNARLRYRIDGAKLLMWYELVRPHKIVEHAVNEVWAEIEAATLLTIFNGSI